MVEEKPSDSKVEQLQAWQVCAVFQRVGEIHPGENATKIHKLIVIAPNSQEAMTIFTAFREENLPDCYLFESIEIRSYTQPVVAAGQPLLVVNPPDTAGFSPGGVLREQACRDRLMDLDIALDSRVVSGGNPWAKMNALRALLPHLAGARLDLPAVLDDISAALWAVQRAVRSGLPAADVEGPKRVPGLAESMLKRESALRSWREQSAEQALCSISYLCEDVAGKLMNETCRQNLYAALRSIQQASRAAHAPEVDEGG